MGYCYSDWRSTRNNRDLTIQRVAACQERYDADVIGSYS